MLIERKKTFVLLTGDENTFSDFFDTFLKNQKEIENENIVVQISETIKATTEDFFSFINIAEQKKQNGTSFVLINSSLNISDFPDYLNIVPTFQEAEDIIEMEIIERELGF
jgi:hypothetical protein